MKLATGKYRLHKIVWRDGKETTYGPTSNWREYAISPEGELFYRDQYEGKCTNWLTGSVIEQDETGTYIFQYGSRHFRVEDITDAGFTLEMLKSPLTCFYVRVL